MAHSDDLAGVVVLMMAADVVRRFIPNSGRRERKKEAPGPLKGLPNNLLTESVAQCFDSITGLPCLVAGSRRVQYVQSVVLLVLVDSCQ